MLGYVSYILGVSIKFLLQNDFLFHILKTKFFIYTYKKQADLKQKQLESSRVCIICLSTILSSLLVETKLYKNTRGKNFISNFRPYKSTYTDNVTKTEVLTTKKIWS